MTQDHDKYTIIETQSHQSSEDYGSQIQASTGRLSVPCNREIEQPPMTPRTERRQVKFCYLFSLLLAISMGTLQFGYSIGSWNVATNAYARQSGWDQERKKYEQAKVQSFSALGSMIGALCSGPLMKIGRWNCIAYANIFVVIGSWLSLSTQLHHFYIGRFIYGIAAGSFGVFCPKYIAETSPIGMRGSMGALTQLSIVFGLMIPFTIGDLQNYFHPLDKMTDREVSNFLQGIFCFPMIISSMQLSLLVIFRHESAQFLASQGRYEEIHQLFKKIYYSGAIDQKMNEIKQETTQSNTKTDISFHDIFFDPKYRHATFVGLTLVFLQQASGTNVLNFYSNMLFTESSLEPETITGIIGITNFLAIVGCMVSLRYIGRRTFMLWGFAVMAVCLLMMGTLSLRGQNDGMIWLLIGYRIAFEMSAGPITIIYLAEISQDKAMGVGGGLTWLLTLFVSSVIPSIADLIGSDQFGLIWLVCGTSCTFGWVFIYYYMQETKCKTKQEIEHMFDQSSKSKYIDDQFNLQIE